jgi:hypothetical protein
MALVRFLSSHRSRAWCARFAVAEEVEIDNIDLLAEVLGAGVAVVVAPEPAVPDTDDVPVADAPVEDEEVA